MFCSRFCFDFECKLFLNLKNPLEIKFEKIQQVKDIEGCLKDFQEHSDVHHAFNDFKENDAEKTIFDGSVNEILMNFIGRY
jgi:hypothetical protein